MDNLEVTKETYRNNYEKYVQRTPQTVSGDVKIFLDHLISLLPTNPHVLEIGSASGRDAQYIREHGANVLCTDVMEDALTHLNENGFETAYQDFRDPFPQEWNKKFNGFLANAVLLHAPPEILVVVLENVACVLKHNSVLAMTLKCGVGSTMTEEKMDAPRYFYFYSKPEIEAIFDNLPFQIILLDEAYEKKWLHIIATLGA